MQVAAPAPAQVEDSTAAEKQAELELLRTSLRRLLERHWPESVRASGGTRSQRRAVWQALAEAGIAELGGASEGGGWQELLLVMEELGRTACPAPAPAAALVQVLLEGRVEAQPLLAAIASGALVPAVALGTCDGDRDAGGAHIDGDRLAGTLRYVEGGDDADQVVTLAHDGEGAMRVAVVPTTAVRTQLMAGLAVPPLCAIDLGAAPVGERFRCEPAILADVNLMARLLLLARAYGSARRMFDLTVDYVKVREQFGQPIGNFQAVQHKLAEDMMALDSCRAMLRSIGQWRDSGQPQWRVAALAALAASGAALRQVAMDAHQLHGAVGYDETHELPRHFRRVHADLARHGGVRLAERELAARLLSGERLPDTPLGKTGERFRQEVRAWLGQHWSAERKATHDARPYGERAQHPEFERALGEQGWLGISWPREHGGQDRSLLEQLAYLQELEQADAPGLRMSLQAPALIKFGTPEQQQFYLPRLLRGEIRICLGYSEPGAGSDLAALRTSAVLDGDEWVINGQKLWSTHATISDYVWMAARTDSHAKPRQAGVSMFIVPLKNHPGVSVRPGMAMYGRTFSIITFDNARVPLDALVGPVNGGWKLLTAALAEERLLMGGVVFRCRRVFDSLVTHVAGTPDLAQDPAVHERLGALAGRMEAARALLANSIEPDGGELAPHAAAMAKVYSADVMQQLGEVALDILGMQATLSQGAPNAVLNGELEQLLRHSLMYTIGGGTQEIQKTLIAVRGLQLRGGS